MAGHLDEQCTGFLIADDVVITVAHCLAEKAPTSTCGAYPTGFKAPKDVLVYAGKDLSDAHGRYLHVAKVVPLESADGMCGNDLVAAVLDAPAGITPLAPRLDTPPVEGEQVTLVGFAYLTPSDPETTGVRRSRDDAKNRARRRARGIVDVRSADGVGLRRSRRWARALRGSAR